MNTLNRKYRRLISLLAVALMSGCAGSGPVVVESANQDSRVAVVVIHFTTADFGDSLHILTEPSSRPVSSHYLIPEPGDDTYGEDDLRVYELVDEDRRAWHAGASSWRGLKKLNNMSVGIELVNQAYCHTAENTLPLDTDAGRDERLCFYPDFDDGQIELLTRVLDGILERHTEVEPTHIVGHADIAPQRKNDPGPRFPWQRLYRLGYGAWYDDDTVARYWEQFRIDPPGIDRIQAALGTYGYEIEPTGIEDEQTRNVLSAFQMHFLPWRVTGSVNAETAAVLFALIEKYYEPELAPLLAAPDPDSP